MLTAGEEHELRHRIDSLTIEHRDLDDAIEAMSVAVYVDQLQLKRMKKRKLVLRDSIERMKSLLIPDMDA